MPELDTGACGGYTDRDEDFVWDEEDDDEDDDEDCLLLAETCVWACGSIGYPGKSPSGVGMVAKPGIPVAAALACKRAK